MNCARILCLHVTVCVHQLPIGTMQFLRKLLESTVHRARTLVLVPDSLESIEVWGVGRSIAWNNADSLSPLY